MTTEKSVKAIELHSLAVELVRQSTLDFRARLLLQARMLAHERGDEMALRSDVEEALNNIKKGRPRNRRRILMGILGGVLFATGSQGFLSEVQGSGKPARLTFYVVLAMIGLSLVIMSPQR